MTLEDRLRDHLRSTEVEAPAPSVQSIRSVARRRTTRNRVVAAGAAAVTGLALFVGAASLMNESSVVDLAGTTRTTMTSDEAAAPESTGESAVGATEEAAELTAPAADLGDIGLGFQRPLLVGVDGGFAGVQLTEAGVVALRSADGVNFSESPTSGFPEAAVVLQGPLVYDGGVFAVLVLGPVADGPGLVARSSDLAQWTVESLPPVDGDGEEEAFVQSVAIADGTVVAVGATFPRFVDPVMVAADLGLLDEVALERNCGAVWDGLDSPIEIVDCDGGEPLAVIPPGTPEHAEILAAAEAPGGQGADIVVWTGRADQPFEAQRLPAGEFASSSVLADDDGFVLIDLGAEAPVVRRSADGVAWGESSEVSADGQRLVTVGGTVSTLGFVDGNLVVQSLGSDDREPTEAVVEVGEDVRFGWITGVASGPGGTAVLLQGSIDALAAPALDRFPESVTVTIDGYTLFTDLESGGPLVVTSPDGAVIHDVPEGSSIFDDGDDLDGVARFDGVDGERLVILDPDTGADLFSVTQEEFVAAMGLDPALLDTDEVVGDVVPTQALMFTTGDGTWRRIDDLPPAVADAFITLEAVGDDEVLVRIERIIEPPDAFFLAEDGELTAEQQAAIDEWERAQQDAAQLVRIPVG